MITTINEFKQFLNNQKIKPINEGQFSWFTQDTDRQIGSESTNKIKVYMYDNAGNKWFEPDYQGYGEFSGKDFYDLTAEMNGYTEEDVEKLGKMKLRSIGIDLAFGGLKTRNSDNIILFPALVESDNYDISNHDFTKQPESDPNQGWLIEDEEDEEDDWGYGDDDDDMYESINESTLPQHIMDEYGDLLPDLDSEEYSRFTFADFADRIEWNFDLENDRVKNIYDYLMKRGSEKMFEPITIEEAVGSTDDENLEDSDLENKLYVGKFDFE